VGSEPTPPRSRRGGGPRGPSPPERSCGGTRTPSGTARTGASCAICSGTTGASSTSPARRACRPST
jgi:hypothetical protein